MANQLDDIFKSKITPKRAEQDIQQLPDDLSFLFGGEQQQEQEIEDTKPVIAQQFDIQQEIIVPTTLQQLGDDISVEEIELQKKAEEMRKLTELKNKRKNKNVAEVKQTIEDIKTMDIPGLKVSELEFTTRVDKTGKVREKVTISSKVGSKEISKIASVAKTESNGEVTHRKCDVKLIDGTNQKQLKGSTIKLHAISYTLKPTGGAVNKSTRVIISVPEDFSDEIIVYFQNSRDKYITNFKIEESEDLTWLGKFIARFFMMTFDHAKSMITLKGSNEPLATVMKNLVKTKDFKIKPIISQNRIVSFYITSRDTKNQWLEIGVRNKMGKQGEFNIVLTNKNDRDWIKAVELSKPITRKYLESSEFVTKLYQLFDGDYDVDEQDETNMVKKLSYRVMKQAFYTLYDLGNENGLKIGGTLSKLDTKKSTKTDYEAEAIIGKTDYLEFFILTYSAVQIVGGNGRKTKDDRNYNSRPYMFRLEYKSSFDEKPKSAFGKTLQEIIEKTEFLSKYPI